MRPVGPWSRRPAGPAYLEFIFLFFYFSGKHYIDSEIKHRGPWVVNRCICPDAGAGQADWNSYALFLNIETTFKPMMATAPSAQAIIENPIALLMISSSNGYPST